MPRDSYDKKSKRKRRASTSSASSSDSGLDPLFGVKKSSLKRVSKSARRVRRRRMDSKVETVFKLLRKQDAEEHFSDILPSLNKWAEPFQKSVASIEKSVTAAPKTPAKPSVKSAPPSDDQLGKRLDNIFEKAADRAGARLFQSLKSAQKTIRYRRSLVPLNRRLRSRLRSPRPLRRRSLRP